MVKKKKSKHSKMTVQQRCLESIRKVESKIRAERKKVQDGYYGLGNNFDIEKFAVNLDNLAEIDIEVD